MRADLVCAHLQTPRRSLTIAAHNTRSQRNGHARMSAGLRRRHTTRHSLLRPVWSTSTTAATTHSSMEGRLLPRAKRSAPGWCPEPSRFLESWLQSAADTCRRRSWICDHSRDPRPARSMDTAGAPSYSLRQKRGTGEAAQDMTTKRYHLSRTIRSLPTRTRSPMAAAHAACRERMRG